MTPSPKRFYFRPEDAAGPVTEERLDELVEAIMSWLRDDEPEPEPSRPVASRHGPE